MIRLVLGALLAGGAAIWCAKEVSGAVKAITAATWTVPTR